MNLNFMKWHLLRGPLMKRVVLRAFMLLLAVIVVSVMQMAREVRVVWPKSTNVDDCSFDLSSNPELNLTGKLNSTLNSGLPLSGASPVLCKESENLIKVVFKVLMEKNFLQSDARSLCVGEKSAYAVLALRHLGFFDVLGVERHPFFSLFKRRFVYELDFGDNHFDFVFSEDLDRVSIPALLVLEMERVLSPGGTGAMLVRSIPATSFLKSSDVVHQCGVGSFKLVVFKKKPETYASFEHFQLPAGCPSFENNKPYMKLIEPITDKIKPHIAYLPNSMNISARNKLIYINLGAGEYAKASLANMLKPYCSNHHAAFEVFIIDHRPSVLSSYVTNPGFNFVYHPALGGDAAPADITYDEFLSAPMDDEGFDFVRWFKETVSDGDFVVLMMKAKLEELKILVELFKSGAICHVDELFLRCEDCTSLLTSLRNSGVYAHQWFGN